MIGSMTKQKPCIDLGILKNNSIDVSEVISELRLRKNGQWWVGECPFCHEDSFNVLFFKDNLYFQCWRKNKCGDSGYWVKLKHLFENRPISNEDLPIELPKEEPKGKPSLPSKFIRVTEPNQYLTSRHFVDYDKFPVGYGNNLGYFYFLIYQKNIFEGWVARAYVEKKKRYLNATNMNSGELLYGYDLIDNKSPTYIVEGIFDVFSMRRVTSNVVATFGSMMSPQQINLLRDKGIKEVVLCYDEDAFNRMEGIAYNLSIFFDTKVCFFKEKDAGDCSEEELNKIINEKKDLNIFYYRL